MLAHTFSFPARKSNLMRKDQDRSIIDYGSPFNWFSVNFAIIGETFQLDERRKSDGYNCSDESFGTGGDGSIPPRPFRIRGLSQCIRLIFGRFTEEISLR